MSPADLNQLSWLGQRATLNTTSSRAGRAKRESSGSERRQIAKGSNRRSAMQVLQSYMDRGEHFQVALTDIDNFKSINDRHGHTMGDEVLVTLSTRLLQLHSLGYYAARLAGDEFLIISAPNEAGLLIRI
jgi:diguanylate cyclase (GGDEF)-like protein